MNKNWPPKIMNAEETFEYITKHQCSIARFGDGEVSLMMLIGIGFQKPSWKLRKDLIEVSKSDDRSFLVCIPRNLVDMSHLTEKAKKWWEDNLRLMKLPWKFFFSSRNEFGDAMISRPWMDTQNSANAEFCFSQFTKIWHNRDVVLIEGKESRLGVGNDLFNNVHSLKRIIGPSKNAYSKIDDIYSETIKLPKNNLILLALGPTATVLAYKLHKAGYWALDIGHIDIEYEWYKMHATEKVPIKNKFVNEAGGYKSLVDNISLNDKYFSEIISCIE